MSAGGPSQGRALDAVAVAGPDEAAAAISRLLAVTEATYERRAQLEQALQSRIVIEQAKGILAERFGLAPDGAFEVLRRAARSNRLKVRELAAEVVPGQETPAVIKDVLSSSKPPR